jgi:hypothetical protein
MAKAKKITGKASFSTLNDMLNKIAPDGEMIEVNPIAKIDEWISTGSYILNACLSGSVFGGLPNRRSLVLAGEEGCLEKNQEVEIYIIKNKNILRHHDVKDFNFREK